MIDQRSADPHPERGAPQETPERLAPPETPERLTPVEPPERPVGNPRTAGRRLDMRAEEGDETVDDYAAAGRQALSRVRGSRWARSRLGALARRFARFWRGEHGSADRP